MDGILADWQTARSAAIHLSLSARTTYAVALAVKANLRRARLPPSGIVQGHAFSVVVSLIRIGQTTIFAASNVTKRRQNAHRERSNGVMSASVKCAEPFFFPNAVDRSTAL